MGRGEAILPFLINFVEEGLEENGRERVFGGGGCVYVLAFSKDTSRTKKKKKKGGGYPPSADGSNKGHN